RRSVDAGRHPGHRLDQPGPQAAQTRVTPSPAGRGLFTADDRQIFRLAVPALGSLAAGPLYVLADTAIIGHLATGSLAGLALAGVLLDGTLALCNFLTFATTAQTGRR